MESLRADFAQFFCVLAYFLFLEGRLSAILISKDPRS